MRNYDWGPLQHQQAGMYMEATEHLLPEESGEPLVRAIDRRGQYHSDGRLFGGVEIVAAGDLPPGNYTTVIHTQEDQNMSYSADRKEVIRSRMEKLEAELHELEQFGEDSFEENTVLVFDMKFPTTEVVYTYAALKKEGVWWLTGNANSNVLRWSGLVNFWKDKVVSIHKAATWDEVFLRETSEGKAIEGEIVQKETD